MPLSHHPLRGIALIVLSVMLFALLDATSKQLAGVLPIAMIVWARYLVHFAFMVVAFGPRMGRGLLRTRRVRLQVLRALMLALVSYCGVKALSLLPLAEVTAVFFLSPLLVGILAGPLLGEQVGKVHWAATLIGFAGVMLIARPGGAVFGPGLIWATVAAVAYTLYQLATRRLAHSENPVTTLFYTALTGTVVMSLTLPWAWQTPELDGIQWLMVVSLGLYGGVGHFLLIRAMALAPVSTLSPFLYVQLVWATLLGWFAFDHWPDGGSFAGIGAIAGAGVLLALHRHGRRRPPARSGTTPE